MTTQSTTAIARVQGQKPILFEWREDIETLLPKEIEFNFDELKSNLEYNLGIFTKSLGDVTSLALKDAKTSRATLNKLRERLEEARREARRVCLEPYEETKNKIEELTGLIDKACSPIDKYIKGEEADAERAKEKEIKAIWDEYVGDLEGLVSYEKFRTKNPRWINVSYKLKEIKNEIIEFLKKTDTELITIKSFCVGDRERYLDKAQSDYLQWFDVNKTMSDITKAEEDAARIKQREAARAAAQPTRPVEVRTPPPVQTPPPAKVEGVIYFYTLELTGTHAQLSALGEFMKKSGITYKKLKLEKKTV